MDYDNYIREYRETEFEQKLEERFQRYIYPTLDKYNIKCENTKSFIRDIYYNCKQVTNSLRSTGGKDFERIIEEILERESIPYSSQVHICDGYVCTAKESQHTVDIIVPAVNIGDTVADKVLLSLKTTTRERWTQDLHHLFKHKWMVTLDPNPSHNIVSTGFKLAIPSYVMVKAKNLEYVSITQMIQELKRFIPKKMYSALDLFSGCGGMSKGFQNAKFSIKCAVEKWDIAVKTYQANFNHKVICKDICEVTSDDIDVKEPIDIIFGGPPCQGFSMAGRRDPKDPRNSLFMEFLRMVDTYQPKIFVIENVQGILTMKTESKELVINIIKDECKQRGYKIKYKVLYAPDFGVPQKRKRVFIIGARRDLNIKISFPKPKLDKDNYVSVKQVLLDREDVPAKYYHSQKMIDGFNKRAEKNREAGKGFGAQYLKMDEPSYTISARYYKDGADALVRYDEENIRKLTEHEVAKIQTFPDDFKFMGSSKDIYTQIGNAVPCTLAYYVAKHVRKILKKYT